MEIPKLKIGNYTADIPIVQGGMGVRVSLSPLAAAVANEGGIGTISSIALGGVDASGREYEKTSREALVKEIRKARNLTNGHLAINIMNVLSNASDLVKTAVQEGIKFIVMGAGLPMKLPYLVEDKNVNLIPIISSARAADLILRAWDHRFNRTANAVILEGPLAGGHLGFSQDQLDHIDEFSLETLLPPLLQTVKFYEDKYGEKIPVIVGGGIYDGKDIARMLSLGASGVQMATRFVCTEECSVSPEFKQAYIDAKEADIVIVKSPVGMLGRAIRNRFLEKLEGTEKMAIRCRYKCLSICQVAKAKYCIANALFNSYRGDVDNGLIFCGKNAFRIDKITTVKELFNELVDDLRNALSVELKPA
jgi:nitronate monooxygenase